MNKNHQVEQYSRLVLKDSILTDFVARLPGVDHVGMPRSESEYYGASGLIASKLGMAEVPRTKASWSHGWKYQPIDHVAELGDYRDRETNYLVARSEHRDVLLKEGFQNAHVVGMPFVYAPELEQTRKISKSLLVCPGHVGNFTVAAWDTFSKSYAALINDLRDEFETVAVCLSASCVETGNWIDAFEAIGVPWIMGASIYDRNALPRMKQIFSSFDYLTSNTIGSHLVYAAHCGCRVSIYGWQDLYSEELLKDEPYSKKYPEIMRKTLAFMQESLLRKRYPNLFVHHPKEATVQQNWAANQLGAHYRRDAEGMADLFGWSTSLVKRIQHRQYQSVCSVPSEYVKEVGLEYRSLIRKLVRSFQKKKFERFLVEQSSGFVELWGKPFKYTNSEGLVRALTSLKHLKLLPGSVLQGDSIIVDASADDGLFMICFKHRWPNRRFIAVERGKNAHAALRENCRTFEIEDALIYNGILSAHQGAQEFQASAADCSGRQQLAVCIDLSSFVLKETISLLRLKLNPFEEEMLNYLKGYFKGVEALWVEWEYLDGGELSLFEVYKSLVEMGFEVMSNFAREHVDGLLEAQLNCQKSFTLIARRSKEPHFFV